MEITEGGDLDRLLATLAADGDQREHAALVAAIEAARSATSRPDDVTRVLAFPVGICAGAVPTLDITRSALRVEASPPCAAPVPSLVVFVVPARIVPDGAVIG